MEDKREYSYGPRDYNRSVKNKVRWRNFSVWCATRQAVGKDWIVIALLSNQERGSYRLPKRSTNEISLRCNYKNAESIYLNIIWPKCRREIFEIERIEKWMDAPSTCLLQCHEIENISPCPWKVLSETSVNYVQKVRTQWRRSTPAFDLKVTQKNFVKSVTGLDFTLNTDGAQEGSENIPLRWAKTPMAGDISEKQVTCKYSVGERTKQGKYSADPTHS